MTGLSPKGKGQAKRKCYDTRPVASLPGGGGVVGGPKGDRVGWGGVCVCVCVGGGYYYSEWSGGGGRSNPPPPPATGLDTYLMYDFLLVFNIIMIISYIIYIIIICFQDRPTVRYWSGQIQEFLKGGGAKRRVEKAGP